MVTIFGKKRREKSENILKTRLNIFLRFHLKLLKDDYCQQEISNLNNYNNF